MENVLLWLVEILVFSLVNASVVIVVSIVIVYLARLYRYPKGMITLPICLALLYAGIGAENVRELAEISIGPMLLCPLILWLIFRKRFTLPSAPSSQSESEPQIR